MWSLIFCLLASIITCVASSGYPDYCDIPIKPGCISNGELCECDNKETKDSKEDIEWTMANAFDNRKVLTHGTGLETEIVTLDMHRALYVETDSEVSEVTFDIIKAPCKLLYYRIDDIFYMADKINTKIQIGKNKKAVFAVVEPTCELSVTRASFKQSLLYHIFLRSQKTVKFQDKYETTKVMKEYKNAMNNMVLSDLGSFIESSQKSPNEENIPSETLKYNSLFPFDSDLYRDDNKKKECFHMCNKGTIIEFELNSGLSFVNTFKLSSTCEWMTVHLNNKAMEESAEISMRHGFVTLPHELKAFAIDFEKVKSKSSTKPETEYEVTVAYFTTLEDSHHTSHMIITNAHGRSVRTKQLHGSTAKIVFAFSNNDCLSSPIGGFDTALTEDQNLKNFPFHNDLNLGYRAASVSVYHAWRYIQNTDGIEESIYSGKGVKNDKKKAEDIETFFEKIEAATTTTPAPIDTGVTIETDAPVVFVMTNGSDYEKIKKEKQEELKKAFQNAIKKDVYLYWAIPAGFCTGSFSSFIIGNLILFFFKRTVMNFWYKAMYKRYGSDTTMGAGTTMGKTGAGETIGGSTTVGGGTTMGGTTAGETGSTTAA